MIPVSSAYREAVQLHRTAGVRNQMHAEITLRVRTDGAKDGSQIMVSDELPYSNADNMYDDTFEPTSCYVTWERDIFRLDGGLTLTPDSQPYVEQGFISKNLSDSDGTYVSPSTFEIVFPSPIEIAGMTLEFDRFSDSHPTSIRVQGYSSSAVVLDKTIQNIDEMLLLVEERFTNVTRIKYTFLQGKPFQRVRMNRCEFGINYVFTDTELLGFTHTRNVHGLSLALPVNELKFQIFNDGRYSPYKSDSIVRLLEKGYAVVLRYGYDLTGSGNTEWFLGGTFSLDSWDVNGTVATLATKGVFSKLSESKFYKDRTGWETSRTHKAKMEAVLQDSGITGYSIDSPIGSIWSCWIPLPYVTHAECLQLLANGTTCVMRQTNTGSIEIIQHDRVPRNVLSLVPADVIGSIKSEYAAAVEQVLLTTRTVTYSGDIIELDRVRLQAGTPYDIPHQDTYINAAASVITPGATITTSEHYAFLSKLQVSGVATEIEVVIRGSRYASDTQGHDGIEVSLEGSTVTIENPLIGSNELYSIQYILQWAKNYYQSRVVLNLDLLGYPECDAGDKILFDGDEYLVLENTITMNGGAMRGKMKLRGG